MKDNKLFKAMLNMTISTFKDNPEELDKFLDSLDDSKLNNNTAKAVKSMIKEMGTKNFAEKLSMIDVNELSNQVSDASELLTGNIDI